MTEPSKMPPDDRELEEFLARRGELSRRYREAQPAEPAPPRLDAPVLAQARRELRRGGRPARRFRPQRLATAATVLLVAGLAWMVRQQPVSLQPPAPAMPQNVSALVDAVPLAASPTAPVAVPAADQAKPAPERARRRAPPRVSPPPPLVAQAAPPPAAAAPATPPPLLPTPAPAPLPQPPSAPAAGAAAEPQASREEVMALRRASTAPSYAAPPPAAFAASAPVAAMPAAKAGSPACLSPPRAAAQAQAHPEHGLDDAAWLEQIRRLQAADPAAARNELACFAGLRPQAAIPDDLRPLLPAP